MHAPYKLMTGGWCNFLIIGFFALGHHRRLDQNYTYLYGKFYSEENDSYSKVNTITLKM